MSSVYKIILLIILPISIICSLLLQKSYVSESVVIDELFKLPPVSAPWAMALLPGKRIIVTDNYNLKAYLYSPGRGGGGGVD
jgi:hypothetical protein